MCRFKCRGGEKDAIVADDADWITMNVCEALMHRGMITMS